MSFRLLCLAASTLALAACGSSDQPNAVDTDTSAPTAAAPVQASLIAGDGKPVGQVSMREDPTGVTIDLQVTEMGAGRHGLHLHEVGTCTLPAFESAGAHLNPENKQHGRDNPQGSHLGDLANLTVTDEGTATTNFLIAGATIAQLVDSDGVALVVHADPDDYRTDPSGNSGDRIACAAFNPA